MRTKEEIREAISKKIADANFQVGDTIYFQLWDGENDFEMEGKITAIEDRWAMVQHSYGVCRVSLTIASKVPRT